MYDLSYQFIYDKISIIKDNEIYRVNDVIKFSQYQKESTHPVCKIISNEDKYNTTILKKFLDYIKNEDNQTSKFKLLLTTALICDKNIKTKVYDSENLLVHIRSGDNYLISGLGNENIYKLLINNIQAYLSDHSQIKNIIIVTALHYGHKLNSKIYNSNLYCYSEKNHRKNINKMCEFVNTLKNIIPKHVTITFQSSENIDIDFLILVKAKNLITSSGGFSKLVKIMNILYNNKNDIIKDTEKE